MYYVQNGIFQHPPVCRCRSRDNVGRRRVVSYRPPDQCKERSGENYRAIDHEGGGPVAQRREWRSFTRLDRLRHGVSLSREILSIIANDK